MNELLNKHLQNIINEYLFFKLSFTNELLDKTKYIEYDTHNFLFYEKKFKPQLLNNLSFMAKNVADGRAKICYSIKNSWEIDFWD